MTGPRAPVRLSIIIPFYDETAFLSMAVRSVLAQGIAGAEVIVVNDNPAVFPREAIAALGLPPAAQIVQQPENRGLSAARNAGMKVAQGRCVGFLDADDYYVADGLAALLDYAETTGADVTHAQTWISRIGSPQPAMLPRDAALFGERIVRRGLRDLEAAQFITSSWSSLYRADFLRDRALTFDEQQRRFEDRLFVLSAVTRADRIAQFGRPVRVWRRRAGSISTSATDPGTHLLQVQLLEKCMRLMRRWCDATGAPPRFLKREAFNTLSRLIWDMDLLPQLARGDDPFYADLAPRVSALMAYERLGHDIFADRLAGAISRVGLRTRRGIVTRAAFFDIQRQLREGDMAGAAATVAAASRRPRPVPARRGLPRLVLHLGQHKTGTTALQHWFAANGPLLSRRGILFPRTGLPGPGFRATRDDGLPGHHELLGAIRRGEAEAIWHQLDREIRQSGARTVILTCENFPMPLSEDRPEILPQLIERLSAFADIVPVAFQRRPDQALDRLYREVVAMGQRAGARTLAEFAMDHAATLADLPGLFTPFETLAGRPVRLVDYDAAAAGPGLLAAFGQAAGLDLPSDATLPRRYETPPRSQIEAARIVNTLLTSQDRREAALRDFFATAPRPTGPDSDLGPPDAALAQIALFRRLSGDWAASRGYAPDWEAVEAALRAAPWQPWTALSADMQEALLQSCLRSESGPLPAPPSRRDDPIAPDPEPAATPRRDGVVLSVRLRPWVARLLQRLGG